MGSIGWLNSSVVGPYRQAGAPPLLGLKLATSLAEEVDSDWLLVRELVVTILLVTCSERLLVPQ